ncbi:MAG: prephenate dehydratase [Bacteroidota bacterium]
METSTLTDASTVVIQGTRGAFHELAARKYFGTDVEVEPAATFPELFLFMEQAQEKFAMLAIENSLAGTILQNYELLRNSRARVVGEVYLRIGHHLLTLPGTTIDQLQEVHSHPMAIAQCRAFFRQYPHIKLVEREDTAASAEWVQARGNPAWGAIASSIAGELYGLESLVAHIETHQENYTRFLVLANDPKHQVSHNHVNKSSLCFHLKHEVGSLAEILSILSIYKMNLTKIQSLPIEGKPWTYFFHIDLTFEAYDRYQLALQAIQPLVAELMVLGEYSQGVQEDTFITTGEQVLDPLT